MYLSVRLFFLLFLYMDLLVWNKRIGRIDWSVTSIIT